MKVWRLYLSCGHDDVTFTNPNKDVEIWNNYNYCEDCDKRVLINKIAETKTND